jgi:DNA-binding SARP family transcriptional activator
MASTSHFSDPVKIQLLGQVSIEVNGCAVSQFRWSRIPVLLAYLLINPGPNSRETIAETLWPDRQSEVSRQNLRQTLHYLNSLFDGRLASLFIVTRQTLEIDRTRISADIDSFLADAARLDDLQSARALHKKRVSHYRGPFLTSVNDEWVVETRSRLARTHFDSLLFLSDDVLGEDPMHALELAEVAIQQEPYEDGPRVAKIRALKALERESAAQLEFESYRTLLSGQLGLSPGKSVLAALNDLEAKPERVYLRTDISDAGAPTIAKTLEFLKKQGMSREASDLAMSLVPFWIRMGNPSQGKELLLSTYADTGQRLEAAEKLALAKLAYAEGDKGQSRRLLQEMLQASPTSKQIAECALLEGRIDLTEVRPLSAKRRAISGLRLARSLNDLNLQMEGWLVLAFAHFVGNQFSRVDAPAKRSIILAERLGNHLVKNHVAVYQAFAWHRLGQDERVPRVLQGIRRDLVSSSSPAACQILCTAGRLMEDLGDLEEAAKTYEECIQECRRNSNISTLSFALTYLGDLESDRGHFDEALKLHLEALKIRRELDQNLGIATSLRGIGRALLGRGQSSEARTPLQESAQRYRDDDAVSGHASSQLMLAEAEAHCGDLQLAIRLAENSIEILRALGPSGRLTIGPSGARILERGEALLRSMHERSTLGGQEVPLASVV